MWIDDLVSLLVAGAAGTAGTSIFWTSGAILPPASATQSRTGFLTLQDTGGAAPIIMHNSTKAGVQIIPAYRRPSAQIVARSTDAGPAMILAEKAWNICVQKRNFFVNGVWYVKLDVVQEPFDLGKDDAGRVRYAFNVDGEKRPTAATS